ncbi:MAG: hypothetical protein HC851_00575 [Acaryochloris sp. RU_4_1]|nr:hypothetical protein [Acaryochloris sp. RU_4_1]NJR53191.1 hypothetical protein [Acaryochloris sp. CRU_2_0]
MGFSDIPNDAAKQFTTAENINFSEISRMGLDRGMVAIAKTLLNISVIHKKI